jgi:hypothetical protein
VAEYFIRNPRPTTLYSYIYQRASVLVTTIILYQHSSKSHDITETEANTTLPHPVGEP